MLFLICNYLLPATFHSQILYCLGLKKYIWILSSTSSSDIKALPRNPLGPSVSTPSNTLMLKVEQQNCIDICHAAQVKTTAK